eukprot:EG_transcript_24507
MAEAPWPGRTAAAPDPDQDPQRVAVSKRPLERQAEDRKGVAAPLGNGPQRTPASRADTSVAKRPRTSSPPSQPTSKRAMEDKVVPAEGCSRSRPAAAEPAVVPQPGKANRWAAAEFGTAGQKEKFLRLMGGLKTAAPPPPPTAAPAISAKPTGDTVWADPEGPGRVLGRAQSEALFSTMEQQFGRGVAYSANRRQGLGFGQR